MGEVQDPAGRTGIGISYADERRAIKHELIFDPETSTLLGERQVVTGPFPSGITFPSGAEVGSATYLVSGVVDSTEEGPTHRR
ncbi:MAG: hypothetical protein WD827_01370 [Solirubrobacterales bacterium]